MNLQHEITRELCEALNLSFFGSGLPGRHSTGSAIAKLLYRFSGKSVENGSDWPDRTKTNVIHTTCRPLKHWKTLTPRSRKVSNERRLMS